MAVWDGMLMDMLLLELIPALKMKCREIDEDAESDVNYVLGIGDSKCLNYKLKMNLNMIMTPVLVNMSKNEVDVNIDDSVSCDVVRSVGSEVGRGNDVRQWCGCWSLKRWWWRNCVISCEWS